MNIIQLGIFRFKTYFRSKLLAVELVLTLIFSVILQKYISYDLFFYSTPIFLSFLALYTVHMHLNMINKLELDLIIISPLGRKGFIYANMISSFISLSLMSLILLILAIAKSLPINIDLFLGQLVIIFCILFFTILVHCLSNIFVKGFVILLIPLYIILLFFDFSNIHELTNIQWLIIIDYIIPPINKLISNTISKTFSISMFFYSLYLIAICFGLILIINYKAKRIDFE